MRLTADMLFYIIHYPQIAAAMLHARCEKWVPWLQGAMDEYQINTPVRMAHFLAQLAHESGRFVFNKELWGPTAAQRGYDHRADLGNTKPEAIAIAQQHKSTPGKWWMGHGPIQITGYNNHKACGEALGLDLLNHPELLEMPQHGARAAGWFWSVNNLNPIADTGNVDHVSDKINRGRLTEKVGDSNGYAERKMLTERAYKALGVVRA